MCFRRHFHRHGRPVPAIGRGTLPLRMAGASQGMTVKAGFCGFLFPSRRSNTRARGVKWRCPAALGKASATKEVIGRLRVLSNNRRQSATWTFGLVGRRLGMRRRLRQSRCLDRATRTHGRPRHRTDAWQQYWITARLAENQICRIDEQYGGIIVDLDASSTTRATNEPLDSANCIKGQFVVDPVFKVDGTDFGSMTACAASNGDIGKLARHPAKSYCSKSDIAISAAINLVRGALGERGNKVPKICPAPLSASVS